jgi:hypothetical protein
MKASKEKTKSKSNDKTHDEMKVSLHPLDFEDALFGLINTKPMPKKSDQKDQIENQKPPKKVA